MPTNLAIDDELLVRAQRLGHHRTKRETVNAALREYVRRRRQLAALREMGTFEFDSSWDYKRDRSRVPPARLRRIRTQR